MRLVVDSPTPRPLRVLRGGLADRLPEAGPVRWKFLTRAWPRWQVAWTGDGVPLSLQFADSTLWLELALADVWQERQLVARPTSLAGLDVWRLRSCGPAEFTM
jgi:hypothetical protein